MALAQLEFGISSLRRTARPILKWAGGKSSLLHVLSKYIPKDFKKYVEPFVGGGAMFFSIQPDSGILGDANGELIACYEAVKDMPEAVIISLSTYKVNSEEFYRVRAQNPRVLSDVERAARMIFLNKTCFNGLYRVNRFGQFNTPFGHCRNVC
jgi:DNA adenine methylase